MKKHYAWKVCWFHKKRFRSAFHGLEYKINRWTYPKSFDNQFLFVFKTRENARRFFRKNGRLFKIFRCEIKNPRLQIIDKQWMLLNSSSYPLGTIFCSAVKLIK